jgi:hypothetical protein
MADTGLLRGTGLRAERNSYDNGYSEKRLGMGRENHVSLGNFVDYYADLGLAVTPDQAEQLRTSDKNFYEQSAARQKEIDEAQAKANEYKSTIDSIDVPDTNTYINEQWEGYKSSFIPVQVVDPNNWSVKNTYMLPKEVAGKIADMYGSSQSTADTHSNISNTNVQVGSTGSSTSSTTWDGSGNSANYGENDTSWSGANPVAPARWVNGILQIPNTAASGQIADVLDTTYDNLYTKYIEESYKTIPSDILDLANQKGAALAGYQQAQGQIDTASALLAEAQKEREGQWTAAREDYQRRQGTIADIYGNLTVGKPDANTATT